MEYNAWRQVVFGRFWLCLLLVVETLRLDGCKEVSGFRGARYV